MQTTTHAAATSLRPHLALRKGVLLVGSAVALFVGGAFLALPQIAEGQPVLSTVERRDGTVVEPMPAAPPPAQLKRKGAAAQKYATAAARDIAVDALARANLSGANADRLAEARLALLRGDALKRAGSLAEAAQAYREVVAKTANGA
jgi:hypothetical protein